jgi:exonuclease III
MEELSQILRELTQVYQQAQHILLTGDFNVALEDEDTRRDKTTNL